MSRDVDWDLVAALYADRSISLAEIERRCGVPRGTISSRAAREGWPMRQPRKRAPKPKYKVLINRMFRALDKQMHDVEQRLETGPAERGPAERERDARTLASLTRILEKLRELEKEAAQNSMKRAAASDDSGKGPDTEDMRAELERRLARLVAAAGEGSVSGEPE